MSSRSATAEAVEDPIEYFLEDVAGHGRSDRTREYYGRVLRDYAAFLDADRGVDDPASASHRDCMAYVNGLRDGHADSTVATYASYLHRFYGYMVQVGVFSENPMALVVEEMDESIESDPVRRDVSIPEMRSFVGDVTHPLDRALVVALLKTGVRVGELCNLDRRDLNLADYSADVRHHPRVEGRPNALFVAADRARGESANGERRTASNKRLRPTVIPVDDELATVLRRWLAIRPDPRSTARPLFCATRREWGSRITTDAVHHVVERHARHRGWYRDGADATENVTPHYFRHFFTTHMRDRTGDRGVVKYLRGDVASDVIDTYTHDWGDRIRAVYRDHVYSVLP